MKLQNISQFVLPAFLALVLCGCAAGAATAGYAIKAQTADNLTADAEQRLIERAKRELRAEMCNPSPEICTPYGS